VIKRFGQSVTAGVGFFERGIHSFIV
jgi:hypothetical protein